MNKKINITVVLLILLSTAFAQKTFVIKGKLAKDKSGLVRLSYDRMGKIIKDSVQFTNGVFEFKGMIETPVEASIIVNPLYGKIDYDQFNNQDNREFYLEFGQNLIKSDAGLKTALIESGQEQMNFELDRKNQKEQIWDKVSALDTLGLQFRNANNKRGMDSLTKIFAALMKHKDNLDSNFIIKHPKSYVALNKLFAAELLRKMTDKDLIAAYNAFSRNIRQSYYGIKLGERLQVRQKLQVGKPAPEISLPSVNDKPSMLSALKGKYVLLCFLQRPSNQVLFDLYQKMQAKDVQIYAVTFSDRLLDWKSEVLATATEWINVMDNNDGLPLNNGLKSAVAKSYNLSGPGQCMLLDPSGNILSPMMQIDPMLNEKIKKIIP